MRKTMPLSLQTYVKRQTYNTFMIAELKNKVKSRNDKQ